MPKLTDAQRIILSAAADRETGAVTPLPKSLKLNQGAAAIVLKSLLKRKLISEQPASPSDDTWRLAKDSTRFSLAITRAGAEAIGLDPAELKPSPNATALAVRRETSKPAKRFRTTKQADRSKHTGGTGTKQAMLVDLLKRKSGMSIAEATKATGWQAHSVRGVLSGSIKKKLGLAVTSTQINGERRYRIEA